MSLSVYFSFSDCSSLRRLDDDDEKREKLSRHLLRRRHDEVSWLFHWIFFSFSRSSGRESTRVHSGLAHYDFGLQLFFCQPSLRVSPPISVFKTRNRSFVRPIVASIPESMFTRKKTRRSLQLSELWFSKAAAKKKETKPNMYSELWTSESWILKAHV